MPAAAKKSGYAPIAQAEDDEAPSGPKPQQQPKVSGVDASGHAEAHWSGLSYEEARNFKNCPSDRIVFPEYSAGFFKFWSFQWLTPIMKLGNRTHLLESDVWAIHEAESCTTNAPPMAEFWAREKKAAAAAGREPTVIWPIFWTVRRRMGIAGAWKVLGDIFKLVNPLILQQILLVRLVLMLLCLAQQRRAAGERGGCLSGPHWVSLFLSLWAFLCLSGLSWAALALSGLR